MLYGQEGLQFWVLASLDKLAFHLEADDFSSTHFFIAVTFLESMCIESKSHASLMICEKMTDVGEMSLL